MRRSIRLAAAVAAATSLAAVAASPASAADPDALVGDPNPCLSDPGFPQCPQYVFDVADRTLIYAQNAYDREVQPRLHDASCVVLDVLTDRECTS